MFTYNLIGVTVCLAVTLLYTLYINDKNVYQIKRYKSVVDSGEDELKKKGDEMDLLFVQLLQWREFAAEYKTLLIGVLPAGNAAASQLITDLDEKFRHLYKITETSRREYMAKIMQQEDYSEEFAKVVDRMADKLAGMGTGQKADDAPILNKNRDN